MQEFDLVVIGGGSAGLRAARTAARLGARVALAEERELGGECLWAGCVPTKAMVRAAEVWDLVKRASEFGIHADALRTDFAYAMAYKDRKVRQVGGGADPADDAGLGRLGVKYYHKRARFRDSHIVRICDDEVRANRVIIATGTVPSVPSIPGLVETGFITNREAVGLSSLPDSLVVLGGGPIGLEFAQVFRRFGADVTVVELTEQILPNEDPEIADLAAKFLREEGIRILTGARAVCVYSEQGKKRMVVENTGGEEVLEADEILVATGRDAAINGLGLEEAGVEYSRRAIRTDAFLRTSQPHILAAGDAAGGYLFTHVASFEGRLAAENAFAETPVAHNSRVIPRATFIDPEIASAGMTEAAAIAAGMEPLVYRASFADQDRPIIYGDSRGLVKLVADRSSQEILGGHIIGPHASSIIQEIVLAMQRRLPVSAIAETMHAYPTFPEVIESAALSV